MPFQSEVALQQLYVRLVRGIFEVAANKWSKQNEDRDIVYHKLLQSLKNANDEIDHLKMNLESETMSRRQYQIKNHDIEAKNKDYEKKAARNPYVIVLVDGDGANFQDSLMGDTETGGSRAAYRLKKQVDENLRETPIANSVEVFARVYANFRGLSKVLRQSGLVRYSDDMQRFARGFTNTRPGFDFIDVDYGKENADSKIRHLLKWHYMDERCKKIFLVACHDAGYVHELRPLLDENSDRVVLVETTPAEPAFKSLGLTITHFDDVFRDAPLEPKNSLNTPSSPVHSVPNHALEATPPKTSAMVEPQPEQRGHAEQGPDSYATVCGDNGDRNIVISKGRKKNENPL
ncbi:C-x8-C-x5-C-x3-H type zinc finger protein [Beauveria bassiana ARSEF 2860]|uniref:C-x8-C-x5-C-x3-H type zinc finger protein n=1 Tax=Beauveria bassiana (strain ARSEF 2860) TaxID=655819 RepID=J4KLD0_BEAB2|nr:C-x8-C-x5-C-x3-H type zinc finger protein [Beauveria bassiana ARSEF 2860]EJP61989.1 C-x8-C-x5-C-x3-H type zinc finger protein [Beauveria bassiana ARSEF 2860]